MAGELAGDVAHAVLGRDDLDVHNGFEHDRPGLYQGVEKSFAAGGHERHVLRIHRVALAVVHGYAHILQRIARNESAIKDTAHPFLHRRDELVRDRAAFYRVDELEALAARERLDPQVDLAELAGAAGLLLVAAVALGARADGLAERDRRRARVELELVLRRHFFQYGFK